MASHRNRRRNRLPADAYRRPGAFLITIVVADRRPLLGHLSSGEVVLSPIGMAVRESILDLPAHVPALELDEWVIMPDHLHMILRLGGHLPIGLPQAVGGFKAAATRRAGAAVSDLGHALWQRSFHDRRLPTDEALAAARRYVRSNPSRP